MSIRRRLSPRALLTILTGLNLFNYLDRHILSGVLTPMKAELGLTDGELGRVATSFMLGYFVTSPFFGYLGDRVSRKWLVAGGIFVWSLGTVLTGLAGSLAALLAFRVMVGLGEASYGTVSPGMISDVFPPARRNFALSIYSAAIPVGAALGFIVGGQVAAHWGWRAAFLGAGAPGLLLALVLLPFEEPRRGEADEVNGQVKKFQPPSVRDALRLFKIPAFSLGVFGYTAQTFAVGAYAYWGPAFLVRVHGLENAAASTFFGGVLVVAGFVGTLFGGYLASRLYLKFKAAYGWILSISAFVSVPLTAAAFMSESRTTAMVCIAVAMLFVFFSNGPVNTVLLEVVPVNLRSSATALCIFMIHFGGDMWSPEIVGRLADRWGDLRQAVLILPGALFVAAILWLLLARNLSQKYAAATT